MKALVEFELHDYMDMYPTKEVRLYEGVDLVEIITKARAWADYMNQSYSGGTTTYKTVLTSMESISYLTNQISKVLSNPTVTRSNGDLDSIDVADLKKFVSTLQYFVEWERAEMAKLS
jgi:hypothetical protein